jgi:hypothetical protein
MGSADSKQILQTIEQKPWFNSIHPTRLKINRSKHKKLTVDLKMSVIQGNIRNRALFSL